MLDTCQSIFPYYLVVIKATKNRINNFYGHFFSHTFFPNVPTPLVFCAKILGSHYLSIFRSPEAQPTKQMCTYLIK